MEFILLGFSLAWDLSLSLLADFFSFGNGGSYHSMLEAENLSGYTESELEENFASDVSHLKSHPYLI